MSTAIFGVGIVSKCFCSFDRSVLIAVTVSVAITLAVL
jgi:hypothetical protein